MMERKWRIYITIVLLIVTYPTVYYSLINSIDYHHLQVNKILTIKPLCIEGILSGIDRSSDDRTPNQLLMNGPDDPYQRHYDCRLHHYKWKDAVTCVDQLSNRRRHRQPVHIAFVGESTVREQYYSFLRLMPDNDLNRTKGLTTALTPKVRISFHADLNVTSELLNLRMSYYWRPLANEEMLNTFRNWNTPPYDSTPDFVLMGFVLNHMHEKTGNNDYNAFAKGLSELAPILRQLSKLTRIVWMLQAPAIHGANTFKPQFTAKIHHYNAGLLKILNGTGVEIWDSSIPISLQYTRSCAIQEREDHFSRHFNCRDAVHTGLVTLEHSSQMLINDICNRHITDMQHFSLF